jgi:hypothetical protein
MPSPGDDISPISFTFEYEGGWAHASIANGAETYEMGPSYLPGDPLFALLQAVVEILRNGDDDTGCAWWYEPALDRWDLHRRGDTLHITIRGRRVGDPTYPSSSPLTPSWFWSSDAAGVVRFRTTCDLWTFAEQVRGAVRQLKPIGDDDRYNPRWPRRTAEYRALRAFLDEHKRVEGQLSGGRGA